MTKTLATLAVSMTAGALLLAWLEPKPSNVLAAPFAYDRDTFKLAARHAVGAASDVQPNGWTAVEVLAVADAGLGRRGTLTATQPPDDFHFLVTAQGDLQPLAPWRRQRATADGQRVIRIGLVGDPRTTRIPDAQRNALRALLLELTELAGPLPVRVGNGRAAPPTHADLRTVLSEQGFLD
ncbi:MAG TPA: hypothetical protein VM243_05060 [Phycisphaerae bacterium]|nr:hypothetical protein [Phycisphaerae bacterium]